MYSRAEAARIKEDFWTRFGQYMSLHNSSEGMRINWVNYHTGYRDVYFRMEADQSKASIAIQFSQNDELMRELFFDKLQSFRSMLHDTLGEEWTWDGAVADAGGRISARVYTKLKGVSIFNESDWPAIISFLKPRLIALDEFWNMVKDAFEELR